MSFTIRNLSVLSYAQGFTFWLYRACDATIDDVKPDGFFNNASNMFKVGDMIAVSTNSNGSTILTVMSIDNDFVTTGPLL